MFFIISFLCAILFYFFFGVNDRRNKIVALSAPVFSIGTYLILLFIFHYDLLGIVWECHNDQCMADGITMLIGYVAGGVVGALANGFIGLHWEYQKRIRWGILNIGCFFALLGVLGLFKLSLQPSALDLKNRELARHRRENGSSECVSVNKYLSSQQDHTDMQICLDQIEKFRASEADVYLAWINLRQFSTAEGFNYWYAKDESRVSVIPEKMQKDFLKVYFEVWIQRESFGIGEDLVDLKSQLRSLVETNWSKEALQYFSKEIAPKILLKLKPDTLTEVDILMKSIINSSQK